MSTTRPRRPVYIHGAGAWTALGRGLDTHAQALAQEVPPAQRVTLDACGEAREFPFHGLAASDEDPVAAVARDALTAAGITPAQRPSCGVFFGSTCSNLAADEVAYRARMHERDAYPLDLADGHAVVAQQLAESEELGGPHFFFGTACSSSGNALLHAAAMIGRGELDTALVVGTERFNRLSLYGFDALELLARERARPFDRARDGLVLGEGAAALVLSPTPAPWRVRGGATLVDTDSPTGSSEATIARVIAQALTHAELAPDDITAIKAHGTATVLNDRAESAGLHQAFAELPPTTSLKGAIGHTLGGCGAIETALAIACVEHGYWPASAGFRHAETEPPGLAPLARPEALDGGRFLMNFFGFGGNNCAYVLERGHHAPH